MIPVKTRYTCATPLCSGAPVTGSIFCAGCEATLKTINVTLPPLVDASVGGVRAARADKDDPGRRGTDTPMSGRYPKYYKPVPRGVSEIDVYFVCHVFNVTDAALSHALKKIMLPGERTGGKTRRDDIKEARDTLTRWIELQEQINRT